MARGYKRRIDAMPRIAVDMDEWVFDRINDHAMRCGVSWVCVGRELLRCAVEDGRLEEYYPSEQPLALPNSASKNRDVKGHR